MGNDANQDAPLGVGVLLYPGMEELDFCGPYEVFKAAGAVAASRNQTEREPLTVFTVAENSEIVVASGGLLVRPHYSIENHPPIDIILVPGGDESGALHRPTVMTWLEGIATRSRISVSVCTGAFILGKLGLLDGISVTTHWASLDRLASAYPATEVQRDVRWVDSGTVVTSAGISAGIDMSLHLVERLLGRDVALTVARYMEYDWRESV